jgi:flagellar assembly protein FliH
VDEEEKSSLDNYLKDGSISGAKNLRLHCFPEISINPLPAKNQQLQSRAQFKECNIKHIGKTGIQRPRFWQGSEIGESDTPSPDANIQKYDEGYQKGFEEGQKSEQLKIDQALNTMQRIFEELSLLRQNICNEAEMAIVKLSLAIARKLLDREIAINPDSILSVARHAIRKVVDSENIKIKVNPSDVGTIEKHKDEFLTQLGKNSGIRIESDGAIQPGGCVIETRFGDIDARVDQQFQLIEQALEKELPAFCIEPTK